MDLIGKKIRGFKFESKEELIYHPDMDDFIGDIGKITTPKDNDWVRVRFKEYAWCYPLPEALNHLVEEEPIIPELEGVEMEVSCDQEIWVTRVVLGIYKEMYVTNNGYYLHTRPIPVKKLTMEELEKIVGFKFEIV